LINNPNGDIKLTYESKNKCRYLVTADHPAALYVNLHTCLAGVIPKQYPPSPDALRSEFCNDNFEQCGRYINTTLKVLWNHNVSILI